MGLEEGITEVFPADGGPSTAATFSAVLVKKDGEWYFEDVRESVARPPSNVEHFADLEWLIGDWKAEEDKAESSTASYSWAENQNFMVCAFTTTLKGIPVVGGTQWIAWDAIDKKVASWTSTPGRLWRGRLDQGRRQVDHQERGPVAVRQEGVRDQHRDPGG